MENLKARTILYVFITATILTFSTVLLSEWGPFLASAYGEGNMEYKGHQTRQCSQAFFGHRFMTRCENDEVICYINGLPNDMRNPLECKFKSK